MIDLSRYGERIGYSGPFEPTLAALRGIMHGHTCSIPFENLDVVLSRPILLDLESLERKLVEERRGGYCFEQNGLLLEVLEQVGFNVRPIAGRVRLMNRDREVMPARTHLFVLADIEGEAWIGDVGVGGMSLTAPIRLNEDAEQETPHGVRRITREDGRLFHQALTSDGWIDVYETRLEPMPIIDRVVGNWYTSTHPRSNFKQMLMCARAAPGGERLTLMNDSFARRKGSETLETRTLATKADVLEVLQTEFGVVLPSDANLGPEGSPWPTE